MDCLPEFVQNHSTAEMLLANFDHQSIRRGHTHIGRNQPLVVQNQLVFGQDFARFEQIANVSVQDLRGLGNTPFQ